MAHGHEHNPLDHVVDHNTVELPGWEIHLPSFDLGFYRLQITRFMVMEVVAAILVVVVIVPLARHAAKNMYTRGRVMNLFGALVMFTRNAMPRPAMGAGQADDHAHGHGAWGVAETIRIHHQADRFLPYL